MRIFIRYQGLVLIDTILDQNDITIGRATDNNIVLAHDSVSRKHAKISLRENKWWYEDVRTDHPRFYKEPILITDDSKIIVEHNIELVTEEYLNSEKTQIVDFSHLSAETPDAPKKTTSKKWLGFTLASIALSGVLVLITVRYFKPMEANQLFPIVRPKVVELVKNKNPKAIRDYKKYAEIKDPEFADEMGFCTGFLIAPNVVLTANHCVHGTLLVDGEESFQIKMHDGKFFKPKAILGFDLKKDFAFLEIEGAKEYGYLELSTGSFNIGEKVYTIGNVSGEGIAIRDGITASKTKDANDPNVEFIRYSAAASPGNSGGPLVDGFGKVVALVFAATRSENYNLGTGSENLAQGKSQFVDQRAPKSITLETRHLLNYRPDSLTYLLYLPVSDTWYEHPDLLRPLENITFPFQLPQDFYSHYTDLISKVNQSVSDRFDEVQLEITKKGLTNEHWESHVTENVPLIIPHQLNIGGLFTKWLDDTDLLAENIAVLAPMRTYQYKAFLETLKKENKYDYAPLSLGLTLDSDKKLARPENKNITTFYRTGSSNYKDRLDGMAWVPIIQYFGGEWMPSKGWEELRKVDQAQMLSGLVGSGLIGSSYASPYLRPNARREFTITKFEEEVTESEVNDSLGRTWSVFSWQLFGSGTLDNYCTPLPQGVLCMSALHQTIDESTLSVLRKNYVHYALSEKIIAPLYWKVDALSDFYKKGVEKKDVLFRDFLVTRSGSSLIINLKTLGIKFEMTASEIPHSIRMTSGLMLKDGKKSWVALGYDALYKTTGKKNKVEWKVCGMGLEPKGLNSSSVLSAIRAENELKKDLERRVGKSQKNKPQIFQESLRGNQMTLYGFCAPIEKYGESNRLMNIQFFGRSPYKVKFSVLDKP